MFEFLGKLLGIALRTGVLMTLDCPSFVWKPLVQQCLTRQDLFDIDTSFVNGVLSKLDDGSITDEQSFYQHFADTLTFSTTLSDQTQIDLKPKGQTIQVNFNERLQYAQAVENARLNESREQIKAIKR